MGFAVLLSDVDIVTLQDPFLHLHRDCDVEGMSDGWDNGTAYGEAHLQLSEDGIPYVPTLSLWPSAGGSHEGAGAQSSCPKNHVLRLCVAHAGYNDVKDDESMGWARYAHSMRVFVINSGLFYIRPTLASLELLDRITYRLNTENGWDQAIFNEVNPASLTFQAFKPFASGTVPHGSTITALAATFHVAKMSVQGGLTRHGDVPILFAELKVKWRR